MKNNLKLTEFDKIYKNTVNENGNAFSASKYLYASIFLKKDKIIDSFYTNLFGDIINKLPYYLENINESITYEIDENLKGGIIVFSTEVNAINQDNNIFIDLLKKKLKSICNYFTTKNKINLIAKKHNLIGWTIGNFFSGNYTGENGKLC